MISVAIAIDNKGHRAQCITPTFPFFTVVSFDEPSTIYQRVCFVLSGSLSSERTSDILPVAY